jgi:hypothetical protein
MGNVTEIQTLECAAGHTWTRKKQQGRPKYCAKHRRFFYEPLPARLLPPMRVRQEWAEQELVLDDPGYEQRWVKFWVRTARIIGARHETWSNVDIEGLEEYVRCMRLRELHRLHAQDEPYHRTDRGGVRAHPGWALADREERRADGLAVELGLKDEDKKKGRRTVEESYQTMAQTRALEQGELLPAVGPEGDPL